MKVLRTVTLLFILVFNSAQGLAQFHSGDLDLSGYTEGLPIWFNTTLPQQSGDVNYLEFRLQNRLNVEWFASDQLQFTWQMRTRWFSGDLVREIPGYADAIDQDDGLINLSWMIAESDNWFLHYIPDRLYGEWFNPEWSVRAGRQRINWGVNTVTNPNDLFNIYSLYDFAYPERPGADAIRIQRFLDYASRIELAFSPGRELSESVAALLYSWNQSGYDLQVLGGFYRNRLAAGGGWAGSIGMAGFKGEFTGYLSADDRQSKTAFVAAISGDYLFENNLFLVVEGLYNHQGGQNRFSLIGQDLAPDNPSFSRYQLTTRVSYPFSPLVSGSFTGVVYPDEQGAFLSPQLSWSVIENVDLMLLGQFFAGSSNSLFSDAGTVAAGSLRWNFD